MYFSYWNDHGIKGAAHDHGGPRELVLEAGILGKDLWKDILWLYMSLHNEWKQGNVLQ